MFQWGQWKQSGSGTETLQAPRGGYRTPPKERGGNPLVKELLAYVHAYVICVNWSTTLLCFSMLVLLKKRFCKEKFPLHNYKKVIFFPVEHTANNWLEQFTARQRKRITGKGCQVISDLQQFFFQTQLLYMYVYKYSRIHLYLYVLIFQTEWFTCQWIGFENGN